ncbi:MAG: hypothetical protein U5L05_01030 [Rubrivivax sp.]|nr:hypothetical protein [Rubrivivax sp.]
MNTHADDTNNMFQIFVLPSLLALLGIAVLRAVLGPRHAAWGGLLGLLCALAWLPGFEWPAGTRTLKLPWIVLAGLGLAVLQAVHARNNGSPALIWLAASAVWAAAMLWLAGGQVSPLALGAATLLGWAVLTLLAWGRYEAPARRAVLAAVLTLASLGLAGLCATGGSLLLAQLGLMLASSVAVVGIWSWWRPASGLVVSPALLLAFGLAWLSIAWSWVLAAPAAATVFTVDAASAARVAVLALVFLSPSVLPRRGVTGRASSWRRGLAVALAILPIMVALAWSGGAGRAPMPDTATDPNDPYLTPSWR